MREDNLRTKIASTSAITARQQVFKTKHNIQLLLQIFSVTVYKWVYPHTGTSYVVHFQIKTTELIQGLVLFVFNVCLC